MKQVKIAYSKYKKKLPNRPPDEIDFGLGFRAALKWLLEHEYSYINNKPGIYDVIREELK